ncbi:MAG: hypothetical protein GX928_03335 [Ruminococcaceae bacterium]|nr:hypothetical protein [Oscillospiraceae bacterium]
MAKNKVRKNKKLLKSERRRKALCLVLAAFCVYFIYSIVMLRINISKEKKQLDELNLLVKEQKYENEELERIIFDGGEKEYIERIARQKLGYAAIDEKIFVDLSGS